MKKQIFRLLFEVGDVCLGFFVVVVFPLDHINPVEERQKKKTLQDELLHFVFSPSSLSIKDSAVNFLYG